MGTLRARRQGNRASPFLAGTPHIPKAAHDTQDRQENAHDRFDLPDVLIRYIVVHITARRADPLADTR